MWYKYINWSGLTLASKVMQPLWLQWVLFSLLLFISCSMPGMGNDTQNCSERLTNLPNYSHCFIISVKRNVPSWKTAFLLCPSFALCWYILQYPLTLKTPRKPASENVTCFCRLLNILANFSNLFFAYRQTVWTQIRLLLEEQSDLGPHGLQKWLLKSQADDKADDNCCDWQFKG